MVPCNPNNLFVVFGNVQSNNIISFYKLDSDVLFCCKPLYELNKRLSNYNVFYPKMPNACFDVS